MRLLALLATVSSAAAPAPAQAVCPDRQATGIAPDHGSPGRVVRVLGAGFAPDRPVFLHRRRKGSERFVDTRRIGRADACGAFRLRVRALRGLDNGIWTLQFDQRRGASVRTVPRGMNDVSIGGCFRGTAVVPCYSGLAKRFVSG